MKSHRPISSFFCINQVPSCKLSN